MTSSLRIPGLIACLAVTALAFPALAATQTWNNAPRGSQIDVVDFVKQLGSFDTAGVEALIKARTVDVVTYNATLTTTDDSANTNRSQCEALDELTSEQGQIHRVQDAIRANPKAMQLLQQHHIKVVSVVNVVRGRDGTVKLFVR